jgi:hypothetical protein
VKLSQAECSSSPKLNAQMEKSDNRHVPVALLAQSEPQVPTGWWAKTSTQKADLKLKKKSFTTYQTTRCHNPDPIIVFAEHQISHHLVRKVFPQKLRCLFFSLGTYLKQTETSNISKVLIQGNRTHTRCQWGNTRLRTVSFRFCRRTATEKCQFMA